MADDSIVGTVEVLLKSESLPFTLDQLSLTMESSDEDILQAVAPAIREKTGEDIDGYVVKKYLDQNKIYVYPKGGLG